MENLLLEINRSREIMGLTPNIILESNGFKIAYDFWNKVVKRSGSYDAKVMQKDVEKALTNGGAGVEKALFRKTLMHLLEKTTLTAEERLFVSALVRRFFTQEITDMVNGIKTKVLANQGGNPTLWNKMVTDLSDPNLTTEFLTQRLNPAFNGQLTELQVQMLRDFVSQSPITLKIPTTVPNKIFNAAERDMLLMNRAWEDIKVWDTDAINKLRSRAPEWWKKYQIFWKEVKLMFGGLNKLVEETQQLIKTYEEMAVKDPVVLDQIGENFKLIARKRADTYRYLKSWYENNIPQSSMISDHFKRAILSNNSYKAAEAFIFNDAERVKFREENGSLSQRLTKARKMWMKLMFQELAGIKLIWNKLFGDGSRLKNFVSDPNFKYMLNEFGWGMTLSPAQIRKMAELYGIPKVLLYQIPKELLIQYVIISAIFSFLNLLKDSLLGSVVGLERWQKMKEKYGETVEYKKNEQGLNEKVEKDLSWVQQYWNYIKNRVTNTNLEGVAGLVPGRWDNLVLSVDDAISSIVELSSTEGKRFRRDIQDTFTNTGNQIDSVRQQINTTLENRANEAQKTNVTGNLQKVKDWLTSKTLTIKEMSPTTDGFILYSVETNNNELYSFQFDETGKIIKIEKIDAEGNISNLDI